MTLETSSVDLTEDYSAFEKLMPNHYKMGAESTTTGAASTDVSSGEAREGIKVRSNFPPLRSLVGNNKQEELRQRFSGIVLEVTNNHWVAELDDLDQPDYPTEVMDFAYDEVSEVDMPLIQPGAMFYYYIGTEETDFVARRSFEKITFRRLPVWTKAEINAAKQGADDYLWLFGEQDK